MKEFDAVIGYKDVKIELERIADMMINPKKYQKLGVKTTRGLLLTGIPGVGKTLMANCLIKASKRKAFTIRKDIPEVELVKKIKETFEEARRQAPSIVFMDDIDKFANSNGDRYNSETYITIQSCIDDCKDCEVFVLATSNDTAYMPRSLVRPGRFDKLINVSNPSKKDSEEIIKYYLSKKKVDKDVDYLDIARLLNGGTCALLETVINEAGVYTGFENRTVVNRSDIIRSYKRIMYEEAESYDSIDPKHLKAMAIYEAGHAAIAEILEPYSVSLSLLRTRKCYYADSLTVFNQKGEGVYEDKTKKENNIMFYLAGRAAHEITYGTICADTNVADDIKYAFDICKELVVIYCVYGFSYIADNRNKASALIERQTILAQSEMERYYQQVKKILMDNKDFLNKIADELADKKTLTYADIQNIKKGCKISLAS